MEISKLTLRSASILDGFLWELRNANQILIYLLSKLKIFSVENTAYILKIQFEPNELF